MAFNDGENRRPNVIYKDCNRYRNLILSDLPADVFNNVASSIDRTFLYNCKTSIFASYDSKRRELDSMSCKDALFRLAEIEEWTVQTLVKNLIQQDKRFPLQFLLNYWPARFVKKPDRVICANIGEVLELEVDVAGIPPPEVMWFDGNHVCLGGDQHITLDPTRDGIYTVITRNVYRNVSHTERWNFKILMSNPSDGTESVISDLSDGQSVYLPPPVDKGSMSDYKASEKIALLIGMTYSSEGTPLKGPYSDLPEIGKRLTKIGFQVVTLLDVNIEDLESSISIYSSMLVEGVYGVLYLSGHGVRYKNIDDDFLIPVGANPDAKSATYLSRKWVYKEVQSNAPGFNLVIWDACRNTEEEILTDVQWIVPGVVHQTNFYDFCSAIADKPAFELDKDRNRRNPSSLTAAKFIQLFDEGERRIGDFLTKLAELIYNERPKLDDKSVEMEPVYSVTQPNRSLWDPVVANQSVRYNEIQEAWIARSELSRDGLFPMPLIKIPLAAVELKIDVKVRYYMHNVLRVTVISPPELTVSVDEQRMWDLFQYQFDNGDELLRKWGCIVHKEKKNDNGYRENIFSFFHLQRYISRWDLSQTYLHIPILVQKHSHDEEYIIKLKSFYIIRLFTAFRNRLS